MRVSSRTSEYRGLFAEGFTVTEIARRCGVAKSTVSTCLKKARKPQKALVSTVCPHSQSCFTCPLADCVMDGADVNAILPQGVPV
nr:MAG TPA: transcriptional regulator RcsB [Caudoviricetes sp.]